LGTMRSLPQEEAERFALDLVKQALEISPDSVEGLRTLTVIYFQQGNLTSAAWLFEKAYTLEPSNTYLVGDISTFLTVIGRNNDGIVFGEFQVSRDPANAVAYNNLGLKYRQAKWLKEAEETLSTAISLSPSLVGLNYEFEATALLAGEYSLSVGRFNNESIAVFTDIGLALAFGAMGQEIISAELTAEPIQRYGESLPYYIAQIWAFGQDYDLAFSWLEKAREFGYRLSDQGCTISVQLKKIPAFAGIFCF